MLGYGTFVMESAGQDQALHHVKWVPDPDHTYRAICAEIFGVDDRDRVDLGDGDDDGPDAADAGGPGAGPAGGPGAAPARSRRPGRPPRPARARQPGRLVDRHPRSARSSPAGADGDSGAADGRSLYQSPDLRRRSSPDADTGPIPSCGRPPTPDRRRAASRGLPRPGSRLQ